MNPQPASPRRFVQSLRRASTVGVAAGVAGAALAMLPQPAYALFGLGDTISDPWAEAKNAQKVAQMLLQLEQMARQLQQLQAQLADLDALLRDPGGNAFDQASEALDALTRMQQTLDRWNHELPVNLDPQTLTINELPERNAQIRSYLQQRLAQAEASLSILEQAREQVALEVASVVTASNQASGPKAAQQASNQLQAILTAEQSKLQALRAMRSRLRVDADAAAQAEEAAAEAVRQREMAAMRQSVETLRREQGQEQHDPRREDSR